jgi:hypothetical protein
LEHADIQPAAVVGEEESPRNTVVAPSRGQDLGQIHGTGIGLLREIIDGEEAIPP